MYSCDMDMLLGPKHFWNQMYLMFLTENDVTYIICICVEISHSFYRTVTSVKM